MSKKEYHTIVPTTMNPRPKPHEESAAAIIAEHLQGDAHFLKPTNINTPDVVINGVEWELKSPVGGSPNCIQKSLREAEKQSPNIVIDLRRTKLHQLRALGYVRLFLSNPNRIKRLLAITKSGKVLVIK